MLKKYRNSPPSFILHLHPTHFRFDQQEGSFSYNSPMRSLLEHIKASTVPHEMIDDFLTAGIKFYENCLIVQIKDHRSTATAVKANSSGGTREKNIPFSIHNYNEHVTPSSYVPYPKKTQIAGSEESMDKLNSQADSSKENVPLAQEGADAASGHSPSPKTFTTVLFPTPQSLQEEILRFANTPDLKMNNRKQPMNSRAQPSTPSTAGGPQTSTSAGPAKKQKMMYGEKDLQVLEAKLVSATSGSLYLEPVNSLQEVGALLNALADPLCQNEPQPPKSRKRTVAELAADEALAAEEQRFSLIMDERLAATNTANGTTGDDGEAGAAAFEPRFERFQAIQDIRENIQERARQKAEQAALLKEEQDKIKQQASAVEQMKKEQQQKQAHLTASMQQRQMTQMTAEQMSAIRAHQQQRPGNFQRQAAAAQHGHPMSTGNLPQGHHGSPVVRNMTPHNNSSPVVGATVPQAGQSHPMSNTNSTQGAGSPPRPGSALQHGHPGAAAMVAQRSQQGPRNGTPSMPNGTPQIGHATPVMRNSTTTPRMTQGSPVNPAMVATPVMGQQQLVPANTQDMSNLTPQQQQVLRQQQQAFYMRQQAMAGAQGSPQNSQMSPQNLQQFAAAQARQQAHLQAQAVQYRQQLQASMQNQMEGVQHPVRQGPNATQLQQQASHLAANPQQLAMLQQQQQLAQQRNARIAAAIRNRASQVYQGLVQQHMATYGQGEIPPQHDQNLKARALEMARNEVMAQYNNQAQGRQQQQAMATAAQMNYQRQQQQAAMMAQMAANGGMVNQGNRMG
jgi:transcription factor SPT20